MKIHYKKYLWWKVKKYEWRIDEFKEMNFPEGEHYGVIAQQIEGIFPNLVLTDANGYKSVDYGHMAPILIEAIKEQQAIIEAQKKEIATEKVENESQQEEIKAQKHEIETIKAEASSAKIISTETAQKLAALEAKLNALLLLNSKGAVLTAEN